MINTTVVISNYNYGRFVVDAIESCISQPCKIIVVDDASNDDSWSILKNYSGICTLVKLKKNSGGNARGKNIGISLCNTKYITCLDSDDLLMPLSIQSREVMIEKCDWVHGYAIPVKSEGKISSVIDVPVKKLKFYKKKMLNLVTSSSQDINLYTQIEASTVLCRKSNYEKVGLYDENLRWKIDRQMWHRFLSFGLVRTFINKSVSIYRRHSSQVTKNRLIKDPKTIDSLFKRSISKGRFLRLDEYDISQYIEDMVPNG